MLKNVVFGFIECVGNVVFFEGTDDDLGIKFFLRFFDLCVDSVKFGFSYAFLSCVCMLVIGYLRILFLFKCDFYGFVYIDVKGL